MIGYLGIDIGSTTVKVVLLDQTANHLVRPVYVRSLGQPLSALRKILEQIKLHYDQALILAVTGSGREVVKSIFNLPESQIITEIYAHAEGAWHTLPGVRTIIDIGGQDNKLIRLHPGGDGQFTISEFVMNELCAAGTGSFLEMHAKELGYDSIDIFSDKAFKAPRASKIAGRCSVLAQSDVVHLRQSGEDLDHIAAGLCKAVVLNVLAMAAGKPLSPPVLFQGGVASNSGVVKALKSELELDDGQFMVPGHHQTMGAIGCALHAASIEQNRSESYRLDELIALLNDKDHNKAPLDGRFFLEPFNGKPKKITSPSMGLGAATISENGPVDVVLGIDAGSASVKCAVLDINGDLLFSFYRLHHGNVVATLHQGLAALKQKVTIGTVKAVAVTGSGRDHIMLRIGADLNIDEITAQAAAVKKLAPDCESIFEIGGQDAKFIAIKDARVHDFEMNKICAAGTGAFVLESAKLLGVAPGQAFDQLAFQSRSPLSLSSRCCVFAKSDIVSLLNMGVPKADVAAGIAYAVVKNYMNLVVGNRAPGKKVAFLGGLAKNNHAVVAALERLRPDIQIEVPEQCEVSGALGAAQVALEDVQKKIIKATRFRGFAPAETNEPVKAFDCNGCVNFCRIKKWEMGGSETLFSGSICGKFEGGGQNVPMGVSYVEQDLKLIRRYESDCQKISDNAIGIPKALLYYEQGPLWITFLKELGLKVVVSDTGHEAVQKGGACTSGLVCLPVKVLLGHCADLVERGIQKIFYPTIVEMERPAHTLRSDNCMLIQASVDAYLKTAFRQVEFISPVFHYQGRRPQWRAALCRMGQKMGFDRAKSQRAADKATRVQKGFIRRRAALGKRFLSQANQNAPCVVLMGHEYSSAPELDMGLSRHLAHLGIHVAPLSIMLPLAKHEKLGSQHSDVIFKSSQNIIQTMMFINRQQAVVYPVVVNQFLCRQDACVGPFLQAFASNRPFLRLVLDENVGHAGLKTRCEAFSHVIKAHMGSIQAKKRGAGVPMGFVPEKKLKGFNGVVWMNKLLRFFAAGYNAVGIQVKFFPDATHETIEKGRKFFPDGEPCLPFIREAGQLEDLLGQTDFDPDKDAIHVPGTRHCASTTLPQIYKRVCDQFGARQVKFVSPRDGLDAAEGVEAFGTKYIQTILRAMFFEDYLERMRLLIRPYEVNANETDTVFYQCMEQFYDGFGNGGRFFKTVQLLTKRLAKVVTNRQSGKRPKILITGEYVVRTDAFLNGDIHKKVESLEAEAVRAPLFSDYAEFAGKSRYRSLWKLGFRFKSVRELILSQFLKSDLKRIRAIFSPYLHQRIEPDPRDFFKPCSKYLDHRLDPVMLLEFHQAVWNMEYKDIDGIVNVQPFGCSISTATEPLLYSAFGSKVPILSLSFDGQVNVHQLNRLGAFMACVHNRKQRYQIG